MDKIKDIVSEYKQIYSDALAIWGEYWNEAHKDLRFFMGDQWDSIDRRKLENEGRNAYVYNYCKRVVKMISGYQRKNRLSIMVKPVESSDQQTADIFSEMLLWQMQYSNAYNTISEAFEGACVTGINLLEAWVDFSRDPINGEIKIDRVPFNSFIIDPQFTKYDLSDCRYIIRRKYITREEAKALLPKKAKEIDNIRQGKDDNFFSYMPYNRVKIDENIISYDEYWKRTQKKVKILIDQTSGEYIEWKGNKDALKVYLQQFPWIKAKTIYKPIVELNVIVGGVHMDTYEDPYNLEDYPFIPVLGYYEPQLDDYRFKLQGIIRSMRDPQEDFNKRRSTATDIIQSQPNTGWIVKNGSIDNPLDITKTGQGAIIFRSRNSASDDITPIRPAEVSQSIFALMQQSQQDMLQIPGASEELMGVAEGGNSEISGVLAKVRSANALTTLQDLFDNLALSQKLLGAKIIRLMQNNFTPIKVMRITNKEPTQEFYTKDFGKYDMYTAEGLLTDTQRNVHYAQLLQARAAGIPIPDSAIIKALPIQGKQDLLEEYEAEAQAQQAQQASLAEQQAITQQLVNSQTISNLSLAAERRSRMAADEALARERLSQAQLDRTRAIIEQLKGVKELEEMDRSRLINDIQFIAGMQDVARETTRQEVLESSQRAMQEVALTASIGSPQQNIQ